MKTSKDTAQDEIEARIVTGSRPAINPADFAPLATCPSNRPPTKRARWARLARRAGRQGRPAIELKCLECGDWQRSEAALCEIVTCPLWAISNIIFKRGER